MKSLVALMTLFLLVVLCGCGASLPSEHDAEQFLRKDVTKDKKPVNILELHN